MQIDEFDKFWMLYPKKQAKGDARKAWMQTEKIRPPLDDLLKAIRVQAQSDQWRRDYGQYIPMPATWLRGERWEDSQEIVLPEAPRKPDRYDLANQALARKDAEFAARKVLERAAG